MSIRSRCFNCVVAVAQTQTGLVVASFAMPADGKVKKVSAIAVGTGSTNVVGVYSSSTNTADDTGAHSTVLVAPAITVAAADTVYNSAANSDGSQNLTKGERLYVKATTYGTAFTALSVQIEVDY